MNSSRPYLVRALYEWIVDNDCTPHMLVNSEYPSVQVPQGFASDGQIVLNVSPQAVRHLHMDNEAVSFEGRFGGVPHTCTCLSLRSWVSTPGRMARAWCSIWNRPWASEDEIEPDDDLPPPDSEPPRPSGRPSLKVVK